MVISGGQHRFWSRIASGPTRPRTRLAARAGAYARRPQRLRGSRDPSPDCTPPWLP